MDDENTAIIRAGFYGVPKMWPLENENKLWQLTVPGEGAAGNQVFSAPTLEGLCSKLGISVWNATNKIRQQAAALRNGSEQEREAELRFAARQEQGLYDDF